MFVCMRVCVCLVQIISACVIYKHYFFCTTLIFFFFFFSLLLRHVVCHLILTPCYYEEKVTKRL